MIWGKGYEAAVMGYEAIDGEYQPTRGEQAQDGMQARAWIERHEIVNQRTKIHGKKR
jgi:hypothetical protein